MLKPKVEGAVVEEEAEAVEGVEVEGAVEVVEEEKEDSEVEKRKFDVCMTYALNSLLHKISVLLIDYVIFFSTVRRVGIGLIVGLALRRSYSRARSIPKSNFM